MNYLTLASMIRNEEHYVQEWLTFHYVQGFEQFVIVLHKCEDKTEERIKALPFADKIHIHKVVSDTQAAQMSAFVWIAENYGHTTEWLMFCDGETTVHTDFTPVSYRHWWKSEHTCHDVARCHHYRFRSWQDWLIRCNHQRDGNANDGGIKHEQSTDGYGFDFIGQLRRCYVKSK